MLLFCLRAGDENCVSLALPVPPGAMWRLKINVRTGKRHLAEIKLRGLEPPQVFPVGNYMREAETPPQRSTPPSQPEPQPGDELSGARGRSAAGLASEPPFPLRGNDSGGSFSSSRLTSRDVFA